MIYKETQYVQYAFKGMLSLHSFFYLLYISAISLNSFCSLYALSFTPFSLELFTSVIMLTCSLSVLYPCVCVYVCMCVCVHQCVCVCVHQCCSCVGASVCVKAKQRSPHPLLGCNLCHWREFDGWAAPRNTVSQGRSGGSVCVCASACLCLSPSWDVAMWTCSGVCVCVCTCMNSSAALSLRRVSQWGARRRQPGRGAEALTAATCHISQLKFGGNQFGTLIRSTTPTPGAAEEPRPPASSQTPHPPPQKTRNRLPGDTSHQS